jgi:hypothetical protein
MLMRRSDNTSDAMMIEINVQDRFYDENMIQKRNDGTPTRSPMLM